MRDVEAMLAEWQQAKVLTEIQAQKVRAYEHARVPDVLIPDGAADPTTPDGKSPVGLISEVLGYLGAVLAGSAVAVMLSQSWSSMGLPWQLTVIAALAVVLGGAGLWLHRSSTPPAQRLSSVLLVASVAFFAWFAGVYCDDVLNIGYELSWVAATLTFAAFAGAVYSIRKRGFPLVAFVWGTAGATGSLMGESMLNAPSPWPLFTVAMVGVAWVAAALAGWVLPRAVGITTGGLLAILALQIASFLDSRLLMLVIGLIVAAALLTLSVVRRGDLSLLVPGALGLLLMLPQLIDEILGDSLLTWFAVLVAGVLLVVLSTWVVRDKKQAQAPPS